MPWNPDVYNQFKNIRYKPFFDLMDLIEDKNNMSAIDLGCGTGEQTSILADKFPNSKFLGIDSSPEMLEQSKVFKKENLDFKISSTEAILEDDKTWDLIFSNAALQWSDHHQELFPKIISKLNKGGQLAVQMPYQPENKLNQILFDLAEEEPYKTQLNNWNRKSEVLSIDDYAQIFFENGLSNLNLSLRIYPIIAESHDQLFDFISGSALIPYLENMDEVHHEDFIKEYKNRIADSFPKLPAIYAFKRLLLYGKKS
ncbi:methyltransferase domain-containing protein [Soonwooa sp.]|uniref:methyltransferase domain-containing protein n=1 Tax=Soonwooa sp. TaxID=1938592 RepID=UPI0026105C28|nr:methyltransferase domain-containing protein [Soonwooa sp.]